MKYNIEQLEQIFIKHSVEAKQNSKELVDLWVEQNPADELPDHFKNDFCLAEALAFMCREITALKQK